MHKGMLIKLLTAVKKNELVNFKITCKTVSRSNLKEEVLKYVVEEMLECFLLTICTMQPLADRYK